LRSRNFRAAFASGLLVLSACAHPITTHLTANRFDSPEAAGKLGAGDIHGGFESGPLFTITPDSTVNPPDFSRAGFSHTDLDGFLAGDLGLLDQLDVGLKLRFNNTTLGQIKYQFLGEPRLSAKEGNFSLAASFAGGGATHNSTNTEEFALGTPITATDTLTETDLDAAVIGGYRLQDVLLIYGGPFWTRRSYSGNISQTGGATGTYPFNGIIQQFGMNVGLQANFNRGIARVEGAGSRASQSSSGANYWSGYLGFDLGFFW
jgi:hypothetical protein